MPISIAGSGTITGISVGGIPDGVVDTDVLAANAVTYAKIGTTEQGQLCKAWVNFNGTSTVAIRASYNVSSITDNGTGDYTVNFTTALVDANYAIHVNGAEGNSNYARNASVPYANVPTSSAFRFAMADASNALIDTAYTYAAVFR
jgi:hypothetical protein